MTALLIREAASLRNLAQLLFWWSLGMLFYVYVGYPAFLAIAASLVRRRRRPTPETGEVPMLSILIAAYNEQANIARKIEQTLALDYPSDRMEVVVLSDGSTDQTDSIVMAIGDPRVRLLRIPERKGKTHAQNEGVKVCRGEILVFSDATTVYHPRALRYLACNYTAAEVGAVSGRYQYFDPNGDSPTGLGTIAFWNYENQIKTLQSRLKTITGCCGCIYSVRRSLYTALPDDIISDLVQPLWVSQKGYRVVFEDRALAYEETTKSATAEFAMRVRIVTRGIRGLLSVPDLLKPWKHGWVSFQLLSHKVLRWLVPFFLIVLFAGSALLAGQRGFAYLLALQTTFYLCALLSAWVPIHRRWRPLGVPLYFCTLNAAALLSVIEVMRGKKYVFWETARSRG
jgi:cellulose synthase/poly-beta-1,6-N-acetylglucosamine synthase-like glycosyltransferase